MLSFIKGDAGNFLIASNLVWHRLIIFLASDGQDTMAIFSCEVIVKSFYKIITTYGHCNVVQCIADSVWPARGVQFRVIKWLLV